MKRFVLVVMAGALGVLAMLALGVAVAIGASPSDFRYEFSAVVRDTDSTSTPAIYPVVAVEVNPSSLSPFISSRGDDHAVRLGASPGAATLGAMSATSSVAWWVAAEGLSEGGASIAEFFIGSDATSSNSFLFAGNDTLSFPDSDALDVSSSGAVEWGVGRVRATWPGVIVAHRGQVSLSPTISNVPAPKGYALMALGAPDSATVLSSGSVSQLNTASPPYRHFSANPARFVVFRPAADMTLSGVVWPLRPYVLAIHALDPSRYSASAAAFTLSSGTPGALVAAVDFPQTAGSSGAFEIYLDAPVRLAAGSSYAIIVAARKGGAYYGSTAVSTGGAAATSPGGNTFWLASGSTWTSTGWGNSNVSAPALYISALATTYNVGSVAFAPRTTLGLPVGVITGTVTEAACGAGGRIARAPWDGSAAGWECSLGAGRGDRELAIAQDGEEVDSTTGTIAIEATAEALTVGGVAGWVQNVYVRDSGATVLDVDFRPDRIAYAQQGDASNDWTWTGTVAPAPGNSYTDSGTFTLKRDQTHFDVSVGPLRVASGQGAASQPDRSVGDLAGDLDMAPLYGESDSTSSVILDPLRDAASNSGMPPEAWWMILLTVAGPPVSAGVYRMIPSIHLAGVSAGMLYAVGASLGGIGWWLLVPVGVWTFSVLIIHKLLR